MSKVPLIALAVLLVALPATASARMQGWEQDRAKLVAEQAWNVCQGRLAIQYADPSVIGRSQDVAGWADEGVCVIYLNPHHGMMSYWEMFCTVMIHETGHAAGFRDPANPTDPYHSHDPNSVMYSELAVSVDARVERTRSGRWRTVNKFTGTDPRCNDHGRPYLEARGVLSPASSSSSRLTPGTANRARRQTQRSRSRPVRRTLTAESRAYRRAALRSEARALRHAKRAAR